jgi:hypothetical protein
MRSMQLGESLNNDLKIHFKSDFDIIRFLKHFERVVQGKRNNKLNSEFESREKIPRVIMKIPMLLQPSKLYTPIVFEVFQAQYERSMRACTKYWMKIMNTLLQPGALVKMYLLMRSIKLLVIL